MYSYPGLFWASFSLLIATLVWTVIRAVRRPVQLLGWPLVVGMMWLYFYGYMAYQAATHLRSSIPDGFTLGLGELVPLLCLVGLFAGWRVSLRAPFAPRRGELPLYRPETIWWVGMFWTCVGAIGTYSVHALWVAAAARGERLDIAQLSGYQVLLFHVGYPGLAMCLWAALKSSGSRRVFYLVGLVLAAAVFIFPYLGAARRGPIFPLVAIFVFLPPLVTKRRPKPAIVIGGLATSGVIMLALITVRHAATVGKWSQAVESLSAEDVLVARTLAVVENEFVNTTYTIGTIYDNGKYQYGTGHASLLLHWIPRSVWPDKPALSEGSYPWKELYADVNAKAHRPLLGFGAAIGGVADSFVQYGFLAPLYWFILAMLVARLFLRAIVSDDPRWQLSYLGVICATHWLVSQSLGEASVPAAAYQVIPMITFALCRQRVTRRLAKSTTDPRDLMQPGALALRPPSPAT